MLQQIGPAFRHHGFFSCVKLLYPRLHVQSLRARQVRFVTGVHGQNPRHQDIQPENIQPPSAIVCYLQMRRTRLAMPTTKNGTDINATGTAIANQRGYKVLPTQIRSFI